MRASTGALIIIGSRAEDESPTVGSLNLSQISHDSSMGVNSTSSPHASASTDDSSTSFPNKSGSKKGSRIRSKAAAAAATANQQHRDENADSHTNAQSLDASSRASTPWTDILPLAHSMRGSMDAGDLMTTDMSNTAWTAAPGTGSPEGHSTWPSMVRPVFVLVDAPMPCAGMGDCGVCAVKARGGYRLACKDGPVFERRVLRV